MQRRHIDLEMRQFTAELTRLNQALDINGSARMKYWLEGWKQAYAIGFSTDHYAGTSRRESEVLARIHDYREFIRDRREKGDRGRAAKHKPWLEAFEATYRQSGGQGLGQVEGEKIEPAEPPKPDVPPSPDALAKMPFMARKAKVKALTGQEPKDGNEARDIYDPWYANWYRDTHGQAA